MSDVRDGFAASPDGLRKVSDPHLKELIERLEHGRGMLNAPAKEDPHGRAFSGHERRVAAVKNSWSDARQHLVEFFDDNIESLGLAQQALVEIARRYDEDDTESARQVRNSGAELGS